MALKATIFKAELQISDLVRHYYAEHSLTLARHPSETDERLALRLLAFALCADPLLTFTRGLSTVEEPDLWRKSLSGEIEHWIELGQPDERRVRRACAQAQQVLILAYGRGAEPWWDKICKDLSRFNNLSVRYLPLAVCQALSGLVQRNMAWQVLIDAEQVWISQGEQSLSLQPLRWLGPDPS